MSVINAIPGLGIGVRLHVFLTLALDEGGRAVSFVPRTRCSGGSIQRYHLAFGLRGWSGRCHENRNRCLLSRAKTSVSHPILQTILLRVDPLLGNYRATSIQQTLQAVCSVHMNFPSTTTVI